MVLNVAVIIASIILYPSKIGAEKSFHLTGAIVALLQNLYIGLGYVKYSYIEHEEQFRKKITMAVSVSVIQSLFFIFDALINFDHTVYAVCVGVTILVSTPLYFYAFGIIKNDDATLFERLAKMNLCLLIISMVGLLFYLVRLDSLLLFPVILAGFIAIIFLWYWQIRLFKHLSMKYDEMTI